MYFAGPVRLIGVRTDIENATPVCFGEVTDLSIEASFSEKEVRGRQQFALSTLRTQGKITGKAKTATIRGSLYNQIFFGSTLETGSIVLQDNEAGTIPSSTAYEIEVAGSETFYADLGVTALDGTPYTYTAGTPTTGQYAVSDGTYTFAVADAGKSVLITYLKTAATGSKFTLNNTLIGSSPVFQAVAGGTFDDKSILVILNKCSSTKFSLPFKSEDQVITEIDFSVAADANGAIGTWSFSD